MNNIMNICSFKGNAYTIINIDIDFWEYLYEYQFDSYILGESGSPRILDVLDPMYFEDYEWIN